jgi:hypothetical protein
MWDPQYVYIMQNPHILVCGAHNSIVGFMVKNLCFLIKYSHFDIIKKFVKILFSLLQHVFHYIYFMYIIIIFKFS